MKNHLSSNLYQFFLKHHLEKQKILVAVSSGVDSMVLLDLILKLKDRLSVTLAVVHVHHGWRHQSDIEYEFLVNFCNTHKIEFFGQKLGLSKDLKDAENQARSARYEFFEKAYRTFEAKGLFVAHHRDDLEETVIKRIFEGAFISNLGAMSFLTQLRGMNIYRPLLDASKELLLSYAETFQVPYFEDETNADAKFLRARLRLQYFPIVESIFGKNKGQNLAKLSQQSELMQDFFEKRFEEEVFVSSKQASNQIFYLKKTHHLFEIINFVWLFFKKRDLSIPYPMIKRISETLRNSQMPKYFFVKNWEIAVSKGFMVLLSKNHPNDLLDIHLSKAFVEKFPAWFYKKVPALKK
jgi:tRNA(Ile)-lysidine synthetase-like protein